MSGYESKYLKYKEKYNTLKKSSKYELVGGINTNAFKRVLTYNDPFFFGGPGLDGDIDDIIEIIYLAHRYGERLHIILKNKNDRSITPECLSFTRLIKECYGSNIIYSDNISKLKELSELKFDIGFICAPITGPMIDFFIKGDFSGRLYMQGNEKDYNYDSTITPLQPKSNQNLDDIRSYNALTTELNPKIIFIDSDPTNGTIDVSKIHEPYHTSVFFKKCHIYQLKKLFGLATPTLPFASGFWFANPNYSFTNKGDNYNVPFGGKGNSWKLYERIRPFISDDQLASVTTKPELLEAYKALTPAYKAYANTCINSTPYFKLKDIDEEKIKYKELLTNTLLEIGKLMVLILGPEAAKNMIQYTKGEPTGIKPLGGVPELFYADPNFIKRTPALFDYNFVFGVMDFIKRDSPDETIKRMINGHIEGLKDKKVFIYNFNEITTEFITRVNANLDKERRLY